MQVHLTPANVAFVGPVIKLNLSIFITVSVVTAVVVIVFQLIVTAIVVLCKDKTNGNIGRYYVYTVYILQ